jgi:hypothetical protein
VLKLTSSSIQHILLLYNNTISATPYPLSATDRTLSKALSHLRRKTLAAHTFFLQPHLAWDFIAKPRLQLVGPDTGFGHFGPLVEADCGKDLRVNVDFPLWTQLFSIFQTSLCAPGGQTVRPLHRSPQTSNADSSNLALNRWLGRLNSLFPAHVSSQIDTISTLTSMSSCVLRKVTGFTM